MDLRKSKILYVEDDVTLSFVTRDNLELRGYSIDYCEDGETALEMYRKNSYDLCILDVMLPKMDGFTLAGRIRNHDQNIPIIFLTAKSTQEDRINGLKTGADDYITKPFSIEELVLKIEVFLKRSKAVNNDKQTKEILIGDYIFDFSNLVLKYKNSTKNLTHKETELLKLLYNYQNKILKREEILNFVWGEDNYFMGRSLDVFISRLRKYLKADKNIKIENIHGIGFRLVLKNN